MTAFLQATNLFLSSIRKWLQALFIKAEVWWLHLGCTEMEAILGEYELKLDIKKERVLDREGTLKDNNQKEVKDYIL